MKPWVFLLLLTSAGLAAPEAEKGTAPAPVTPTPDGFDFKDADQDGINDNLVKDLDQLSGQAAPEDAGGPVDAKGGRQEARGRYRHGYHGQELERARNLHQ